MDMDDVKMAKMIEEAEARSVKFGMGNHGPYDEYFNPLEAYFMSQTMSVPYEQYSRWAYFFELAAETGQYKSLMSDKELAVYNSLPDELIVFRGVKTKNIVDYYGFSWSLSRDVAKWFSENRGETDGEPIVLERTISKSSIIWVLLEREEQEVVLLP